MFDVLKIEFKRIQEEFYYFGKLQEVGALTKSNNRYNINLTCKKILTKKQSTKFSKTILLKILFKNIP